MIENKNKIVFNNNFMTHPLPCKNFYLVQAGESLCPPNTIIPEHAQQYFELSYIDFGNGTMFANEHAFSVDKHDCFISFPDEIHKILTPPDMSLRYIFLAFYAKENSFENKLLNKLSQLCKDSYYRTLKMKSLKPLLIYCLQELQNADTYTPRIIGALLEYILIEIFRNVIKDKRTTYYFPQTNKKILAYDIIFYIDNNINAIKKLSELENVFFYKLQYLSKVFKAQAGVPINHYFISKKMEIAKDLLQSGKSVTEVSEYLLYSSVHAFSRAYANYFNKPPSSNRAKKQKNNPKSSRKKLKRSPL